MRHNVTTFRIISPLGSTHEVLASSKLEAGALDPLILANGFVVTRFEVLQDAWPRRE